MLMLQRAAETVSGDDECNDQAVLLACALGSTGCPAKCAEKTSEDQKDTTRVIAGDLNVSVVDYSSEVKSAPMGIFVANKIKFDASEKIELDNLTLKRIGLGTQKSISKVWLEKNGVAVTNSASVGSDGLAVLNFKTSRDTISSTEEFDLVVQLNDENNWGVAWDEFAFELKSVDSTAKNTNISGKTSTYRISSYNVVKLTAKVISPIGDVANDTDNNAISYKLGDSKDYIIWEFSLESDSKNDDRDIYVKSLTFKNQWTLDFEDTFKNIKVYRDSKVVSNNVEINGKDVTISLDEDAIKANRKATYTIRAEVKSLEDTNKTVKLALQNTRDIVADEQDTEFRTSIAFAWTRSTTNTLTLNHYKFNGGKVTLESASNFAKTVNAGSSSTDIVIAKGKITVTEPIELPTITIPYSAANNPNNGWYTNATAAAGIDQFDQQTETIKRLVLKIGDKRYTADPDTNVNSKGNFVFSDVVVRETSDIELLISIGSKVADGSTIEFKTFSNALMSIDGGTYQNNDATLAKADIAGNMQIAKVVVKKPKFTLTSESLATQETVVNNSDVKSVMKGRLEAKDNLVNVNRFTVKVYSDWQIATAGSDTVEVSLYLDGEPRSTSRALTLSNNAAEYSFNSLGTINSNSSLPFEIRLLPTISHQWNVWVDVKASWTDNEWNETETSLETSATLEVKGSATMDITSTSTSDRVVKPSNGVVLYEGTLNVKNSNAELRKFKLTTDYAENKGLAYSNLKIYIDWESVETSNSPVAGTDIEFLGMTENLEEGKHTVQVKGNVTASVVANAVYNLKITAVNVAFDWDNYSANPSSESSNTYFAKGWFNLSKTSTSDKVLTVKLTNNSEKVIRIDSVDVSDNGATVSIKEQSATYNTDAFYIGTKASHSDVTVWEGESIEIQVIASNNGTAKLTGISYKVEDSGTYNYKLTNANTAVGSWWSFYSINN